jgi:hypothetical protein
MDRRDKRPLVDPKAFELAEHFLIDLEGDEATEDQKWELAGVIQDAVESWCEHGATQDREGELEDALRLAEPLLPPNAPWGIVSKVRAALAPKEPIDG